MHNVLGQRQITPFALCKNARGRCGQRPVSNLSHDLRSPLTATVACLEALESRCSASPAVSASGEQPPHQTPHDERRSVLVAPRNTRNAARMAQSLGDLALAESGFKLRLEAAAARKSLDDMALRFTDHAARRA